MTQCTEQTKGAIEMIDKTGRVGCECGGQIMSNSGKVISKEDYTDDTCLCWKCGKAYSYDAIGNAREPGTSVIFHPPGKDFKIFQMNDCDWWYDKSLSEAIKNYSDHIDIDADECTDDPHELTNDEIKSRSFTTQLERLQSMSGKPEFFASTES